MKLVYLEFKSSSAMHKVKKKKPLRMFRYVQISYIVIIREFHM